MHLLGSQDGKSTLLKREYQCDPIGRLLQATSRLGVETFAFDPAGNLLDDKCHELTRPLERAPRRNRLMDTCCANMRTRITPMTSGAT